MSTFFILSIQKNQFEGQFFHKQISSFGLFFLLLACVFLTSVRNILEGVCIRKTRKYIPQSALRNSKLFIELANRVCLILDNFVINKDGSGKFRTEGDKPDFKLVILILLMMNRLITSLLANE